MRKGRRMAENGKDYLYIGRVETDGGALNIRETPGGRAIGQMGRGETAMVLADEGEWVKIAWEAATGYAAKRYIRFEKAQEAARLVITDAAGKAFVPEGNVTIRLESGPID